MENKAFLKKLKIEILRDPATPLSGIYAKENEIRVLKSGLHFLVH
jgi:hypothetical protein